MRAVPIGLFRPVARRALLFLAAAAWLGMALPARPALFITPADVERAREGIQSNPAFASLAEELLDRARTNRIEDLPRLEREWWEAARTKPWGEIYPDIFHHTFIVPMKWADLARVCARASLIAPASAQGLAEKARRVLLGLADYSFEFEHYDVGMNYTLWVLAALEASEILHPRLTAAERTKLDAFFGRYLAALSKNDDYWVEHEPGGKLNNHYAWHKLGLAMMGLFHHRPELVERALRGPKGVESMLAQGFKDDGLWLEGSIPYQLAETAPLVILARMLEQTGHPESLFQYRAPDGRSLKQAYDALIPLLFPDRTLPTLGDCYGRRPHLAEYPEWEVLYRQFREPAYAWLLADRGRRSLDALFHGVTDLPAAPPPPQPGKVWPEMGYVALRSDETTNYWSGRGWSAFATFSGQTVHEHADKLSLLLFGGGHLWLPDCEARPAAEHAFSSAIQRNLNRETLCHNTLLVDGRSQRVPGQRLQLLEFTNTLTLKRASFGDLDGRLYDGVRQLRTVALAEDYVLDFFQVTAAGKREFAWMIHVAGVAAGGSDHPTHPAALPQTAPWSYLRDATSSAAAGGELWECFSHGRQHFRMDLLADGPVEVIQCGFPVEDGPGAQTIPMRLIQRRSDRAWFLAVYRLAGKTAEAARLTVTPLSTNRMEVTVRLGARQAVYALPRL